MYYIMLFIYFGAENKISRLLKSQTNSVSLYQILPYNAYNRVHIFISLNVLTVNFI